MKWGFRSVDTRTPDHRAFKLSEGIKHLGQHPASRDSGINGLSQRAEPGARRINLFQNKKKVLERAGQTVKFPDHHHIAFTQIIEKLRQFRSVPATTLGGLFKDLFASGFFQRTGLDCRILVVGFGHTGITKKYFYCVTQLPIKAILQ